MPTRSVFALPSRGFPVRSVRCGVALLAVGAVAHGAEPAADFGLLDLAELAQIRIVTATKRPETIADLPAAITVLPGEELLRTGSPAMPDALRWVPGIDVTRTSDVGWGVGSRGFGGQFSNHLLVLSDGRPIYHLGFGGVTWVGKDFFFPDLDRVEVVRGPGGAVWGSNAVNGVINILSKDAHDTLGGLAYAGGGGMPQYEFGVRQGFTLSPTTAARVWVQHERFAGLLRLPGVSDTNGFARGQAGFRSDRHAGEDRLTVQGDFLYARENVAQFIPDLALPEYGSIQVLPTRYYEGNLSARWTRLDTTGAGWTVQSFVTATSSERALLLEQRRTFDLDVQRTTSAGAGHALAYGAGYRVTADRIGNSPAAHANSRPKAIDQTWHAFLQDEIALNERGAKLVAGAKLEHNDYVGWQFQPNLRLLLHPAPNQTVWFAVSRAVAPPNRLGQGFEIDQQPLPPGALFPGSPRTRLRVTSNTPLSETVVAYEAGWRLTLHERLTFDTTLFRNRYEHLHVLVPGTPDFTQTPPLLPVSWTNGPAGTTYGGSLAVGWEPLAGTPWKLQATYTYFESDVARASLGRDAGGGSPRHKATLRSTYNLGREWQFDAGLRFVDALPAYAIPSYCELDVHLGWMPHPQWTLELVGRNLLDRAHPEHPPGFSVPPVEDRRGLHGKVTWRF